MVLTLYSRPGCHLCEEMKAVIDRVQQERHVELREVDISADPGLERRYGKDIPVLELDGKMVAKHRIDEASLGRIIEARS